MVRGTIPGNTDFTLDSRIEAVSCPILDHALCQLRLMDDSRFPWLLLIPRQFAAEEWTDLSRIDQHTLSDEIAITVSALQSVCKPDKVNVATLGNQVRQLHVHVIARYYNDPAWPDAVWCHGQRQMYDATSRATIIDSLRESLGFNSSTA